MDTNEYFERELEIINEITDSFDYDSEEIYSDIFEYDSKNVKEPIEDFLKYYREKTEKNDNKNTDFPMYQGQKLAEIISLNPEFIKQYGDKVTRDNCYNFLTEKIESILPNDDTNPPYTTPLKSNSVSKWFYKDRKPQYRVDIFKISFALDLPLEENIYQKNYCHKSLFNKVFKERYALKSPDELCFMYAKKHHLSYIKALDIFDKFIAKINNDEINTYKAQQIITEANETKTIIGKTISDNLTEEEFINLLLDYYPVLNIVNTSLKNKTKKYIDIISNKRFLETIRINRNNVLSNIDVKTNYDTDEIKNDSKDINLKNFLLFGGYPRQLPKEENIQGSDDYELTDTKGISIDRYERTKYEFLPQPYSIYNKLDAPEKSTERTYYEKARKALIYYHFITYWCPLENEYEPTYDDYLAEINQILDSCMLPTMYPFNMFDFFYLYCSKTLNPISTYFILTQIIIKDNTQINLERKINLRKSKEQSKNKRQ